MAAMAAMGEKRRPKQKCFKKCWHKLSILPDVKISSYSYLFMAMAVDQQLYPLKHQSVSPAFKASHVLGLWHWIHVLHLLGESLQVRISGPQKRLGISQECTLAVRTQKDI